MLNAMSKYFALLRDSRVFLTLSPHSSDGNIGPTLKPSTHFLTQSCDPISRYGKPVERTNEIISKPILLIRSTGFL